MLLNFMYECNPNVNVKGLARNDIKIYLKYLIPHLDLLNFQLHPRKALFYTHKKLPKHNTKVAIINLKYKL